ncbi:phytanoyl-CoA dioxygenase family protein [Pseudoalteromonas sp. OOF1S-7]|uniref:phytanoyl-CoA dioxygenase family protein n=1 Tax=Pseudoalteromonas sp. OOF1S-7 TaxID=2917757 RepID=UPI001EF6E582|nr:phytanoyl-CoA dioxygenase family protein [Pseudoalteromonas sp. OOF1S-7]
MDNCSTLGFAIFDSQIINHTLLDSAHQQIGRIINGHSDTGQSHWGLVNGIDNNSLTRIAQPHFCSQAFYQLLTESDIGPLIADVLKCRKLKVWGSQLYIKPPGHSPSLNVGWHRDSQHMPFFKSGVATLWIPFSATSLDTGCLKYIGGSQNTKEYVQPLGGQELNLRAETQRLSHFSTGKYSETPVEVPLGGFSLHHWDLIHGSDANTSDKARIALSVGVYTEDLCVDRSTPDYGYSDILNNPRLCPSLI